MAELKLHEERKLDYITVCPMCGGKDSLSVTFEDASGDTLREVHICQPCPCVWFDYHSQEDIDRLNKALA